MKYIYLYFSKENNVQKNEFIKNTSHNLLQIWSYIRQVLESYLTSVDEKDDIDIVNSYIIQFHEMDKHSFTFRYPIKKDLSSVLSGQKKVDLLNLKCKMNELYTYFFCCIDKISEFQSIESEIESEMFS
jgi:hypothetical protein